MENRKLQSDPVSVGAQSRPASIAIRILIMLACLSTFALAQANPNPLGLGGSCSAILDLGGDFGRSFGHCPLILLAMNDTPQVGAPQTPIISFSSSALDFGTRLVGTSSLAQKVTITNVGN